MNIFGAGDDENEQNSGVDDQLLPPTLRPHGRGKNWILMASSMLLSLE
jgi:hypothetical protein